MNRKKVGQTFLSDSKIKNKLKETDLNVCPTIIYRSPINST